jgi:hypothetical protein
LQNDICEIKLRAERKAGTLLADMEKNPGARAAKTRSQHVTALPTLRTLGIGRMQACRWQQTAKIPEAVFEKHLADVRNKGRELTSAGVLDLAKVLQKANAFRKRQQAARAFAAKMKVPDHQNIIHGDMGLLWNRLADDSVDLMFSDPP